MSEDLERKNAKHQKAMEKQKQHIDARIKDSNIERGVALLLTGNGKGKSSSAFGMVIRALGYKQKVAVVQFIKGEQLSGEEIYIQESCPEVELIQMATGFTWDTQSRENDTKAALKTWQSATRFLRDSSIDLVILDELTYMLAYHYLDEQEVIAAIKNRPAEQSVVVTGRGGGSALRECMDTVSEIKNIKHAFDVGVTARKGVDY